MRTLYFEKNIPKILLAKALRPIWPGVVYSLLSPTQFKEIPDAPLPGARWIRVRNRLCGICATDLHLFFVEAETPTSLRLLCRALTASISATKLLASSARSVKGLPRLRWAIG